MLTQLACRSILWLQTPKQAKTGDAKLITVQQLRVEPYSVMHLTLKKGACASSCSGMERSLVRQHSSRNIC